MNNKMKKYKLLKDLPFAKAGEIFESRILDDSKEYMFWGEIKVEEIENFDEWFEEIGEPEWVYYINAFGGVVDSVRVANLPGVRANLKSTGNYFKTKEEAEKYLEYLKAKEIIKQDTKGFKPDWSDRKARKYYGYWDFEGGFKNYFEGGKPSWSSIRTNKELNIYFKSWEDIEESFKKHPEEWKTYLTYEQ